MNIDLNGIKINYHITGEGRAVILLHGWLCSLETMQPLAKELEKNFKVYNVDLPGFGKSDMPKEPFHTDDFGDFLNKFVQALKIENPILIGHSNGGRTILNYASRKLGNPKKIILIDSAGIKPKRKLSYYIKVYTFKGLKKFLNLFPSVEMFNNIRQRVLGKFGSSDYKNSPEILRKTMSIIINEDQREKMEQIEAPTLLIWGENDTDTPLEDGRIMEEKIPNASLVVLKNAGHFSYLDSYEECIAIIKSFLKEESIE